MMSRYFFFINIYVFRTSLTWVLRLRDLKPCSLDGKSSRFLQDVGNQVEQCLNQYDQL